MKTVWAVTSYDNGGNAGHQVEHLYTTEEAAQRYVETHRYNHSWGGVGGVYYTDGREGDRYDIEPIDLYEEGDPDPVDYELRPGNQLINAADAMSEQQE